MPVDVAPNPVGNVQLDLYRRTCQVLTGDELVKARADETVDLHLPHHVTCPKAEAHRRPHVDNQTLFDPGGRLAIRRARRMRTVATITICHHPRCQTSIKGYELACRPHWYELPTPLRNRIWRAWKSGDRVAHGKAVTEALGLWLATTEALGLWLATIEAAERPLRCHNCKAETILVDDDTDQPICHICARAQIPGKPAVQSCLRCGRDSDLLIAVDDGEGFGLDLCPDCQVSTRKKTG